MDGMETEMDIAVIGISHKTAEVAIREQVAVAENEQVALANLITGNFENSGCMVLSTCNRTEVYFSGKAALENVDEVRRIVNSFKNTDCFSDPETSYTFRGLKAVQHFFKVISSLDSQIVGETQITCQVKAAYNLAHDAHLTDDILNKLQNFGLQVEKKVRSQTFLTDGAVSISFAAVEMARKIFQDLQSKNVLLIGAGETAELAAFHFRDKKVASINVVNRTASKAKDLAGRFGGQAFGLEQMDQALEKTDIVITATSSREFVLNRQQVERMAQRRNYKPLFLIDIAIPRDIDPTCAAIDGVFLFNLDDLEVIVAKNLERRRTEIPKAERIIEGYIKEFVRWYQTRPVTETISRLNRHFEKGDRHAAQCWRYRPYRTPDHRAGRRLLHGCGQSDVDFVRTAGHRTGGN